MTPAEYEAIATRHGRLLGHRNPDVANTARDRIERARRLLWLDSKRVEG